MHLANNKLQTYIDQNVLPIKYPTHLQCFLSLSLHVATGKVIHSMVAHLDAVTSLATDPKGTYLISGSK